LLDLQKPIISRIGVYGIAWQDHKLLLVKQDKGPHCGKWDLPGGRIEPGEGIEQAIRRECLEEVGMIFDTLRFYKNITAITEASKENGDSYLLHQMGLIYKLAGISLLQNPVTELEYAWLDLEQLTEDITSPLLKECGFKKSVDLRLVNAR